MDMTDGPAPVISVEVIGIEAVRNIAIEQLDPGAEASSSRGTGNSVYRQITTIASDDLRHGIASICSAVTAALAQTSPDTCAVEFNVGFKADLKVPVLMSGEANAALKITLGWKRGDRSGDHRATLAESA